MFLFFKLIKSQKYLGSFVSRHNFYYANAKKLKKVLKKVRFISRIRRRRVNLRNFEFLKQRNWRLIFRNKLHILRKIHKTKLKELNEVSQEFEINRKNTNIWHVLLNELYTKENKTNIYMLCKIAIQKIANNFIHEMEKTVICENKR